MDAYTSCFGFVGLDSDRLACTDGFRRFVVAHGAARLEERTVQLFQAQNDENSQKCAKPSGRDDIGE